MIKRNEKTAELVGLTFGDGSFTLRKTRAKVRFQLRGDLTEDRDHYDDYIIPLFEKEIIKKIGKDKVSTTKEERKNCYGIYLESKKILEPFSFLGIPLGTKKELQIPTWIKKSKVYTISFLRGLFDTDGCIYCQKNYSLKNPKLYTQIKISITTCSRILMKKVGILLKKLKIKNSIKEYKP